MHRTEADLQRTLIPRRRRGMFLPLDRFQPSARQSAGGAAMTCLSASIPLPLKPNAVSLSELAIGAGSAGQSVTVHFQDFPAHILCKLW